MLVGARQPHVGDVLVEIDADPLGVHGATVVGALAGQRGERHSARATREREHARVLGAGVDPVDEQRVALGVDGAPEGGEAELEFRSERRRRPGGRARPFG